MGFQDKVTSTSDELNTESERQDESRYNEVSPYMKSGAIYKTGQAQGGAIGLEGEEPRVPGDTL